MNSILGLNGVKRAAYALFFLVGLVPVGGCSGIVERRWVEDVQLDDGSTLSVSRYEKFKESNSLAGDAYGAVEIDSRVSFRGDLNGTPVWSVPLQPLLLYREPNTKELVIVATAGSCEAWYSHGSPTPPYWEYRLTNGVWKEVPLSSGSMNRKTNLFFLYERPIQGNKVTLESKRAALATSQVAPMYLSITSNATWGCTSPAK